jgi:2,3-dihydroxybiphenyl 1,2-dioxygenase
MTAVTELGYVRFGVSDLSAWRQFAAKVLGLEVREDGGDKRLHLRTDQWHHRITLEDGDDDLYAVGLRVAGPEEFRQMQGILRAGSVSFEIGDAKAAQDRHVLEVLLLKDPDGTPIEIFHGPQVDTHRPFYPGRGMFGKFVTSEGGLGHAMLVSSDLSRTYAFYKLLGMRGSIEYKVPRPDGHTVELLFMHCNSRDHTLAFGMPAKGKKINHLMMEVSTLDDVYLTYELVKNAGVDVAILPGKHANDQMFSFYCISPSGFQIEIGWGARNATHQSEYYTGDSYGHQFTPAGMPS